MNGEQIVNMYYPFILERCKLVSFSDPFYKDMAHDICIRVIELQGQNLINLRSNVKAYLTKMCLNQWLDTVKGRKIRSEYAKQYINEIQNIYSQLDAESILALSNLNHYDNLIMAAVMKHPGATELSKAAGIHYSVSKKFVEHAKHKIKDSW